MIKVEKSMPIEDIAKGIEQTPLMKKDNDGNEVLPYSDSKITFEEIPLSAFKPTTLYVVRENLAKQRYLSADLAQIGEDPLQLDSALRIEDGDETFELIPPVIEEDRRDGLILVDGAHRVYLARQCAKLAIRALVIRGVNPQYPVYAHANEWDEVVEYDEVPPTHLKKKYRVKDPYSLYRDFSKFSTTQPRTVSTES